MAVKYELPDERCLVSKVLQISYVPTKPKK